MSYLVLLALVAGPLVLVLVARADRRRRSFDDSYVGEVVERWTTTETGTHGPTTSYRMRIRTDDGCELTVHVDGVTYRRLSTGDRVMRTPATRRPVRLKRMP
ncbi:hypothetical protein ACIQBJ_14035 [Kitasatospora sp. NPDC088391]|uniref:DUF7489 domain-containing protein n=1 Tax=Kitasatospora sp. NPDC088391 TaxID=3364074 RepID=UPI003802E4C2